MRPSGSRAFVGVRSAADVGGSRVPRRRDCGHRHRPTDTTDLHERSRPVTAYSGTFQSDANGVLPTIFLILVIVLTTLGILAHVAFA
jgi:hypothetical protein